MTESYAGHRVLSMPQILWRKIFNFQRAVHVKSFIFCVVGSHKCSLLTCTSPMSSHSFKHTAIVELCVVQNTVLELCVDVFCYAEQVCQVLAGTGGEPYDVQ